MSGASTSAPLGGDQNRAAELIAVSWTECIISIVFVALRFYSRMRLTKNPWFDDAFMFITLVIPMIVITSKMTDLDLIIDHDFNYHNFMDRTRGE